MRKFASVSEVVSVMNHPRSETGWIVRAEGGKIERITRVVVVRPKDGAGRLRVAVTDWHDAPGGAPRQFVASCSGYGYDKFTAALAGMTLAGVEVGDHCDPDGRPNWEGLRSALEYRTPWRGRDDVVKVEVPPEGVGFMFLLP